MDFKGIAAMLLIVAAGPALAQDAAAPDAAMEITGDAEAGAKVFRKCAACHAVGEDAENKIGPALNGVVGRVAGTHEGFDYSDAMVAAGEGGMTWTPEELDAFLLNPKQHVPGTKMSFPGLRKDEDRADVIAYLAGFAEDGTPAEEEGS